jgi:protein-tyrosine-phosphatase
VKLLFVCTGNVCRSPIAAALAAKMLASRGRADVEVGSAGTAAADGAPVSEGAYLVGLEHGLDLSSHAARHLTRDLVAGADLILAMSDHHVERAVALGGGARSHLLGTYAGRVVAEAEVDDPFGADLDTYRRTYDQLEALLRDAIDRLPGTSSGAAEQD